MTWRQSIGSDARWTATFALSSVALLMPALYNRFPLLFPDSDAYFEVAYGRQWTLDRSGFYGLFLKPFVMPWSNSLGLWLAIAAQAAIVALIMLATTRKMLPKASPGWCALLVVLTALTSSVSWHVAQLMPDAFTGALILLVWLVASRDADAPGSPLLWLCTAFLGLVHYTHLPLLAIAVATTLACAAASGTSLARIRRRVIAATITIFAVIAAHVMANGFMFDRWTVSPMGGWFLFARVHQDGLAEDWLARHCGRDAPEAICKLENSLPRNSQTLLWSKSSPLYQDIEGEIGTPAYWKWTDMLGRAAIGSIREEPVAFFKNSAAAATRQFLTFEALDDHCPLECKPTALLRFRPRLESSIRSSRQLTDNMNRASIRRFLSFATGAALLLLLPMFMIAIRRRDKIAVSLLATIVVSLVANAAVTGALSDVQPRYQSRVAWLAVFSVLVIMSRWSAQAVSNRTDVGSGSRAMGPIQAEV